MSYYIHGRMNSRVKQLASQPGLIFSQILTSKIIDEVLRDCDAVFRNRIFPPAVTLWVFLWQVLSADHTCGGAVARVLAWRASQNEKPCSANTSSYCDARSRLPLDLLKKLLWQTSANINEQASEDWLWKGRNVKLVDGTTASMPDTPANQKAFPQANTQKPGIGFPITRMAGVFSLSCGAALDLSMGPYKGKKTGENSLFRLLMGHLSPDDVIVADRYYSSYCDVALLLKHSTDLVIRKHHLRNTNLSRSKRLGKGDYLVTWNKPSQCPKGIDKKIFDSLPAQLILREVTIYVSRKGCRTEVITLVTTLLDSKEYTRKDLAEIYHRRWDAELDIRALKSTLQMDILRCRTPQMVEKEVLMHLLAYNAVRLVMVQSAISCGKPPDRLSFSGALQLLRAFHCAGQLNNDAGYITLLTAIAQCVVPKRPNRVEPRAVKRRPKPYPLLNKPRKQARKELL